MGKKTKKAENSQATVDDDDANLSSADELTSAPCAECEVDCRESGVKCSVCKLWTHYVCSGLSIQTIIRTELHEFEHKCINCLKQNYADYDERRERIKGDIATEKKDIARASERAPNTQCQNKDKNPSKDAPGPPGGKDKPVLKKPQGKEHPKYKSKPCRNYIYNTCSRTDEECNFIHPETCKKALKKKPCYNSNCSLFHFRQQPVPKGNKNGKNQTRKPKQDRRFNNRVVVNSQRRAENQGPNFVVNSHRRAQNQGSNFDRRDFLCQFTETMTSLQNLIMEII